MKRNSCQQIYFRMGRVGLVVALFLLVSSSSALFGQAATREITTASADDATALPLLPPIVWLEKNGITLDEFLQQLRRHVDISVTNAGFVQVVGAVSPARLQENIQKPIKIAVQNAGATQTLALIPPGEEQIASAQSTGIEVQQAGAQANLTVSAAPRFAASLPVDAGIQVEQAGYTREFDLIELAWP